MSHSLQLIVRQYQKMAGDIRRRSQAFKLIQDGSPLPFQLLMLKTSKLNTKIITPLPWKSEASKEIPRTTIDTLRQCPYLTFECVDPFLLLFPSFCPPSPHFPFSPLCIYHSVAFYSHLTSSHSVA